MKESMFCFQCQETAKGTGCTVRGVCGKNSTTSARMDLLLFVIRGISIAAHTLRTHRILPDPQVNAFVIDALFSTITNANFDEKSITERINRGFNLRNRLVAQASSAGITFPSADELTWNGAPEAYDDKAAEVGVLREPNEDLRSLKELIVYGLKGMAAYTGHAMRLGYDNPALHEFIQRTLSDIAIGNLSVGELTARVLQTGTFGVQAMALLDQANTGSYGNPEITEVNLGVRSNPGILISGHDLKDMEELLRQTEGTGIDVYTHSEMLPAHYYPAFKKYKHFAGNYGNSWWRQVYEFQHFNGPMLFTTNCIVPPHPDANYKDRVYTTGSAGFPGFKHIERKPGQPKDFSEIIEHAKRCPAPEAIETGSIIGGFAHNQVFALADKIVDAVKSGAIRKFFVMAGCDGRMKGREYYTEFAQKLPKDTVILTAGCAKYRYNKLPLGDINGIPRVLDAGQCNDSYSLAVIALKLKEIFRVKDINELPIVYNIAWYEQKAVIVLLALLYLGVKNIHLGPTLPGFLSPNVAKVLVEKFGIAGITTADDDLKFFLEN